jgi:hypothetical protein
MHPYRKPPACPAQRPPVYFEELLIYGLLVVVGAIPVAMTLAQHGAFGSEATLGILMLGAGTLGAIALWWRTFRRRASSRS